MERTLYSARCGWLVSIAFAACSSTPQVDEVQTGNVRLEVLLAGDHLELARAAPTTLPLGAMDATARRTLSWDLADTDGRRVASGSLADPRTVRFETFGGTSTVADPHRDSGAFTIVAPDTGGVLTLRDELHALATLELSPMDGTTYSADGYVPGKADVDFDTDLIGEPLLMLGDGEAEHHFNLLFVPEGYLESEQETFVEDVRTQLDALMAEPTYAAHQHSFNAWLQSIKSASSGVAEPDDTEKDTAFNVSFGDEFARPRRCLMPSDQWQAASAASLSRLREMVGADAIVVIANTDEVGGCADPTTKLIVMSRNGEELGVLAHELGHALFDLQDEYDGYNESMEQTECSAGVNVATDLDALPWANLLTPDVALPTLGEDTSVVGAFEGGGYCTHGAYRPQHTCMMREVNAPFCVVCAAHVEQIIADRTTK